MTCIIRFQLEYYKFFFISKKKKKTMKTRVFLLRFEITKKISWQNLGKGFWRTFLWTLFHYTSVLKRLYTFLLKISRHYARNFPRGRDGGGRNLGTFADSRDTAVCQTLNEVRRSLPRAAAIFPNDTTQIHPRFSPRASRGEKKVHHGRVSLGRITDKVKSAIAFQKNEENLQCTFSRYPVILCSTIVTPF